MKAHIARRVAAFFRPKRVLQVTLALDLFLLLTLAVAITWPQDAVFVVDATSEKVELVLAEGEKLPSWGNIPIDPAAQDEPLPSDCSPAFLVLPEVASGRTRFDLTASPEGVALDVDTEGPSIGQVRCPTANLTASRFATGFWPTALATSRTWPFAAELTIGALPVEGRDRSLLLRDGKLFTESASRPFRTGRFVSEAELHLGDKLTIQSEQDNGAPAQAFGVLRAREGALHVVARARGSRAEILRIGQQSGDPVAIAPTLFDRVRAQPQWAVIVISLTVLLNMLGAARTFYATMEGRS